MLLKKNAGLFGRCRLSSPRTDLLHYYRIFCSASSTYVHLPFWLFFTRLMHSWHHDVLSWMCANCIQLYPIVMLCADAMAWIFACLVVPACNLHIICVCLWEWLERVQIFHFDRYKDVGAKVFWLYILLEQSECLHRAVLGAFISVGLFPVLHRVTTPQFCVNGFQWVTARVGRKIARESVSDFKANCW